MEHLKGRAQVERKSERELVVTRTFNGPPRLVFEAWTNPALFQRWWIPKSFGLTLRSCDMDVRLGGTYRLVFGRADAEPMTFHGKYLEVTPNKRLVWTNEEAGPDGVVVTTVSFEDQGDKTLVVVHELHPSKEALDEARVSGVEEGTLEAFGQLDELLVELLVEHGAGVERP